ncbi:MAG: hypothetical protein LC793_16370 [Thermomicrobia bacterium]|nr:hypothetical protein [Thermomicrobia bacterium]
MGYLKQVEPILDTTRPTYVFSQKVPAGNLGMSRRDQVIAIGAIDFGYSPFGENPAPQAAQDWVWGGRILTKKHPDVERDKLLTACGHGEPQRLVWVHDNGYERVVTARFKSLDWPRDMNDTYYVDAKVTWQILETWRERGPANQLVAGLGAPITAHAGAPTTIAGSQSFPILGGNGTSIYAFPLTIADASVPGLGGIPNHADTAPILTITGPMGGDYGFIIYNYSQVILDKNGTKVNPQIGCLLYVPPGYTCQIDCAAQKITLGSTNVTNYKYKLDAQPYWFIVKDGVNNGLAIASNGPNGINASQEIAITPAAGLYPSSGGFQLQASIPGQASQTTFPIPFNSTPAYVQAQLAAFAGVGASGVRVVAYLDTNSGYYYNSYNAVGYDVMWIGALAGQTVPTMTVPANTFNRGTIGVSSVTGSLTLVWTRRYR